MKPFNEFRNKDASFWAFIKFISETMGYTDRRCSTVKSYSEKEIRGLCQKHNINISDSVSANFFNRLYSIVFTGVALLICQICQL